MNNFNVTINCKCSRPLDCTFLMFKQQLSVVVAPCVHCRDAAYNRGVLSSRESTSHQQEHAEIMREVTHS